MISENFFVWPVWRPLRELIARVTRPGEVGKGQSTEGPTKKSRLVSESIGSQELRFVGMALFLFVVAIYALSPLRQSLTERTRCLRMRRLRHRDVTLNRYSISGIPYQLYQGRAGRVFYGYPWRSSVLSRATLALVSSTVSSVGAVQGCKAIVL